MYFNFVYLPAVAIVPFQNDYMVTFGHLIVFHTKISKTKNEILFIKAFLLTQVQKHNDWMGAKTISVANANEINIYKYISKRIKKHLNHKRC